MQDSASWHLESHAVERAPSQAFFVWRWRKGFTHMCPANPILKAGVPYEALLGMSPHPMAVVSCRNEDGGRSLEVVPLFGPYVA